MLRYITYNEKIDFHGKVIFWKVKRISILISSVIQWTKIKTLLTYYWIRQEEFKTIEN